MWKRLVIATVLLALLNSSLSCIGRAPGGMREDRRKPSERFSRRDHIIRVYTKSGREIVFPDTTGRWNPADNTISGRGVTKDSVMYEGRQAVMVSDTERIVLPLDSVKAVFVIRPDVGGRVLGTVVVAALVAAILLALAAEGAKQGFEDAWGSH